MGARTDQAMGRLLAANNRAVRRRDPVVANPREADAHPWHRELLDAAPAIAEEWSAFEAACGRLPRIEELLDEHQGNEGSWRAGLLILRGRPVRPLADRFPAAVEALGHVDGLLYAIWSVLEPGVELREHTGPNAGVLRYHLTVRSNPDAALSVGDRVVPYVAGEGVLFDDTAPHAAWNRGRTPRVSILCEILRPVEPPTSWGNVAVQRLLSLDRRYRAAPRRAAEWDRALNPRPVAG